MLRSEEHTAMVPADERERLENLFKGDSEAVNCLVCTPTLELGIDIGRLDSVLMRNVPPLPANYRQRAGRAGRRHRMAVDLTYCRPVSHDRAFFSLPDEPLSVPSAHSQVVRDSTPRCTERREVAATGRRPKGRTVAGEDGPRRHPAARRDEGRSPWKRRR